MVHPHGGVHELDARGVAGGEDGVEVGGAERGGLLEEDVLPAAAAAVAQRTWRLVGSGGRRRRRPGRRGGPRRSRAGAGVAEEQAGLLGERAGLRLGAAPDGGHGGAGARSMARASFRAMEAHPMMPKRTGSAALLAGGGGGRRRGGGRGRHGWWRGKVFDAGPSWGGRERVVEELTIVMSLYYY